MFRLSQLLAQNRNQWTLHGKSLRGWRNSASDKVIKGFFDENVPQATRATEFWEGRENKIAVPGLKRGFVVGPDAPLSLPRSKK